MTKTLLTVTAALAALAFAGPAQASYWPGTEQPALEAKLPTHVKVFCATTTPITGALGWTWLEYPEIYLSAETCSELANGNFAYSYLALYHEWWHQAFHEHNEAQTNTGALAIYRWALRRYWGFTALKAQSFYDGVWKLGFADGYQPTSPENTMDPLIEAGF